MQDTSSNFLATIKDAYRHNWVIQLQFNRNGSVTGMVNTYTDDGHFYLTHDGDVREFQLNELRGVQVLTKKWWTK